MQIVSKQLYSDNWYIILSAQQLLNNGVNAGRCKALLNIKCQVSSTKQAKGDSGKEPKLQQVTSGGKHVANRC